MSANTPEPTRPPCPDAARTITCQQCVEFILDYIDGVLPADVRFKFESHIAFCRDCEIYIENYRKAAELARAAGAPSRPGGESDGSLRVTPAPKHLVDAILRSLRDCGTEDGKGHAPH
ncbi:MAG: anti-sigma factor family protein [Phycisphaerales bacterium]|jgi:hypothetical protein|nr:zf-HC2 domain-containing protein [Phycisphaeraceae bacterium]